MNDLKNYILRLDKTMTRKEKLFFLKKINFSKIDYIVDFGCAEGRLLYEIDKFLSKHYKESEIEFYGIEKNPDMAFNYHLTKGRRFSYVDSLDKANIQKPNAKVMLILSSVLHELPEEVINEIKEFVEKQCEVVVIRDMLFTDNCDNKNITKKERQLFEELHTEMPAFNYVLEKQQGNIRRALYEYFLKYTYSTNWDSEREENYFNPDAKRFVRSMYENKSFYQGKFKRYILPYKKRQVRKTFGFKMQFPTHLQAIFFRKSNLAEYISNCYCKDCLLYNIQTGNEN